MTDLCDGYEHINTCTFCFSLKRIRLDASEHT